MNLSKFEFLENAEKSPIQPNFPNKILSQKLPHGNNRITFAVPQFAIIL